MPLDLDNLTDNVALLQQMVRDMVESILANQIALNERDGRIETLEHQLRQALKREFGPSSERYVEACLPLFEQMVREADEAAEKRLAEAPSPAPAKKKPGHGRNPLPAELERKIERHTVP